MSRVTDREKRDRRHQRLRQKVAGTAERPRLCVTRSLQHLVAQVIDDDEGKTLVSASSIEPGVREDLKKSGTGNQKAAEKVGQVIAQRAKEKNIKRVVFDRGGNRYHGRVKAFADAVRKAGLEF